MVSMKQLSSHLMAGADPVVQATKSFLYGTPVECSPVARPSTTGYLIPAALNAITNNRREDFVQVFTEIRRRKVQADADWVFDNFLLFSLTVGALKFREDRSFLTDICRQRIKLQQGDELGIAQALEMLIRDERPSAHLDLALVVKTAIGVNEIDKAMVKGAYIQAKKALAHDNTDPFQMLIAQRAVDLAFEHSDLATVSVTVLVEKFQKRAAVVAAALFWLICLGCLAGFCWLLWHFFFGSGNAETIAEKLISLGLGGLPLLVFGAKKRLQAAICDRLRKFWLGL